MTTWPLKRDELCDRYGKWFAALLWWFFASNLGQWDAVHKAECRAWICDPEVPALQPGGLPTTWQKWSPLRLTYVLPELILADFACLLKQARPST